MTKKTEEEKNVANLFFIILNNVLCLKENVFMFPFFFFFYCVPVCCAVAGNHEKILSIVYITTQPTHSTNRTIIYKIEN